MDDKLKGLLQAAEDQQRVHQRDLDTAEMLADLVAMGETRNEIAAAMLTLAGGDQRKLYLMLSRLEARISGLVKEVYILARIDADERKPGGLS